MTRGSQNCKLEFFKMYGWRPSGAKMAPFSHILGKKAKNRVKRYTPFLDDFLGDFGSFCFFSTFPTLFYRF